MNSIFPSYLLALAHGFFLYAPCQKRCCPVWLSSATAVDSGPHRGARCARGPRRAGIANSTNEPPCRVPTFRPLHLIANKATPEARALPSASLYLSPPILAMKVAWFFVLLLLALDERMHDVDGDRNSTRLRCHTLTNAVRFLFIYARSLYTFDIGLAGWSFLLRYATEPSFTLRAILHDQRKASCVLQIDIHLIFLNRAQLIDPMFMYLSIFSLSVVNDGLLGVIN